MNLARYKTHIYWVAGFITVEALSFLTHYLPELVLPSFVLATFAFIALAYKKYELAVLVALAEVFLGSHGHVLTLSSLGVPISIRVVLFAILVTFALPQLRKNWRRYIEIVKFDRLARIFSLLLAVIAVSVVHGVLQGYPLGDIFYDSNNYIFLLFSLPLLIVTERPKFFDNAIDLLVICGVYLSAKTLLLLYLFTNSFYASFLPDLYVWLRDARLGEFTPTTTGAYRIFFQSQFYLFPVWWILLWRTRRKPVWREVGNILTLSLISSALLVSFSRSFWLGWLISGFIYGVWLLFEKDWVTIIRTFLVALLSVVIGFALVWVAINFPLPIKQVTTNLDFVERLNVTTEAAASSRWNLLEPLWQSINRSVVLGQGLGSSITYISDDPRVRAVSPTGEYTTTAFEWGYLDQWLKLGIAGVLLYIVMGTMIFISFIKKRYMSEVNIPLAFALVALYALHIGTPYLNHPLGITFILLLMVKLLYDRNPGQLT